MPLAIAIPNRVGLVLLLVGSLAGATAAPQSVHPLTGKPWLDMDYGPFLTASIEAPQPATNIAFKGIAIRLADAFGGENNQAVVFDTDLLRYSAGWTGGFVALKGVVFDGEHWAYPQIAGDQVFGNPVAPGWAKAGSFRDPREFPYGPLPRDWGHWRGLYLNSNKVVLAYSVQGANVLELPGLERRGDLTAFSRTINVSRSDRDLVMQIALATDMIPRPLDLESSGATAPDSDARRAMMVCSSPPPDDADSRPPPATVSDGLEARFDFDEGQGDVARSSPRAEARLQLRGHQWTPGRDGKAIAFDGRGFGELALANRVNFDAHDVTIAAWIRTAAGGTILSRTAADGPWVPDGKSLFVRGGRLCFDVGWVGVVESRQPVAGNRWTHVAMTWSHRDGRVALFINGRADAAGVLKPKNPSPQHVTRIGFTAPNFPAEPWFRGQMDDLRIYSRPLSPAEIQALAGSSGETSPLAVAVVGSTSGLQWRTTPDGQVRLRIPAGATPARFKVLLARVPAKSLSDFASLVRQAAPPSDLSPLIRGGPSRWPETLTTKGILGNGSGPYAIDTLTAPDDNPWHSWMRFGGFDFFRDPTRAAICTWSGDVWLVSGMDDQLDQLRWRRVATGLFQPLGLKIVDDQVYVLGRDQITRLHDLNGDGEADFYENFNNDTLCTEHFHEFAMDLQTDAVGNFYYMKAARHAREALHPQHGTLMKVSPDGARSEIIANGFRAPNGLLVTPTGEFYTTDQEGYWMPANRLDLVRPGGFYGNNWSWLPEGKRDHDDPPVAWIHPSVDRSPATLGLVTSDRWGPLRNRLVSVSYGMGRMFLVLTETVDGVTQGGVTPFPLDFGTGVMRCRFNERDGQFYVCGLFGWAGNKTQPGGFYRIRYTGRPLNLPTALHVTTNGVVLGFSDALDPSSAADPRHYSVQVWNYRWTQNYGSPDFKRDGSQGRDRLVVAAATLSADRKTVFLELPGITPVMQMHLQMNLRTAAGAAVQTFVHHTVHRLAPVPSRHWLGDAPAASMAATATRLEQEATGLIQTFANLGRNASTLADTRRARLLALHVPAGTVPTPFLTADPFTCAWEGFVKLDLGDRYTFHAVGRGRVTVNANDAPVLNCDDLEHADQPGPPVALNGGLNRLRVTYESPAQGDAIFRLYWSSPTVASEPVPPAALVHDATHPALVQGEKRRLGRELFARRQCIRCHAPSHQFPGSAMPELAMDAPALDDRGRQFNPDWLIRWLENPRGEIAEAWMPALLHGTADEARSQARNLAAFLATLKTSADIPDEMPVATSERLIDAGEATFRKLGCVACHRSPGEGRPDGDTRRTLGHVRDKWRVSALTGFLLDPTRRHRWTRMPDFKLSPEEARALAAYLTGRAGAARGPEGRAAVGDPIQGREAAARLGCANCHSLPGVEKRADFAPLATLAGRAWRRGCLADRAADRGQAPDFAFTADERDALRGFLENDVPSLDRTSLPEFAERQYQALRCFACHSREDGGDTWFRLESTTGAPAPATVNPYDDDAPAAGTTIHRQRPPLTWLGEKLRPEWVEQFLSGRIAYKPRPKLEARMPAFPAGARDLARGFAMEHGFPPVSPPRAPIDAALAGIGQALIQKGALACVDCHSVGPQAALAGADTVTINFAWIPERLNKSYFDRYLLDPQHVLPGTMMPKFSDDSGHTGAAGWLNGDARRQFESIWQFMRTVPPPDRPDLR